MRLSRNPGDPSGPAGRDGGAGFSSRRLAAIAGLLYLVLGILAAFDYDAVMARVYVPGDPATTAGNVLANSGLVRLGAVAEVGAATAFVLLAIALYRLLGHVNRTAAVTMVMLVAVGATMMCLDQVYKLGAVVVAGDPSLGATFGSAGSNALVLLLLDLDHVGFLVAGVFFGLWLVPLGYLVARSGWFPRVLGVLLIVGAASYVINSLLGLLVPGIGAPLSQYLLLPPVVGEVGMIVCLLVIGLRTDPSARRPSRRGLVESR